MDLGCAGHPEVRTPHLDRFASEGVRFTGALATSPVCGPSRASLLTGLLPTRAGVPGNDLPLRDGVATFGTVAAHAGCRTGYIGKWHLDGLPRDKFTPPGPRRFGFDHWAAFNCSHAYFQPRYYRDDPEMVLESGYEPEVQTGIACEFLDDLAEDDAFCLFLSWGPPHDPYSQVPEEYRAIYDPASITLRGNVQPDAANPLAAGKDCRRTTADYLAAMTALDVQFGRLMETLDRVGRREDTLVVFTSDHGDMLWSHGWMKKQLPHEEAVSIPLLARWPGVLEAGRVETGLLTVMDFLPTLGALMGWAVPAGLDGRDLSDLWRGVPGATGHDAVLLANYVVTDEAARQHAPTWRSLRTATHTYAERDGGEPWLFFDNTADPLQLENRIADPAFATERERLADRLGALLAAQDDPFRSDVNLLDHLALREAWAERDSQLTKAWGRAPALPNPTL